jgi:hypothetical protein
MTGPPRYRSGGGPMRLFLEFFVFYIVIVIILEIVFFEIIVVEIVVEIIVEIIALKVVKALVLVKVVFLVFVIKGKERVGPAIAVPVPGVLFISGIITNQRHQRECFGGV